MLNDAEELKLKQDLAIEKICGRYGYNSPEARNLVADSVKAYAGDPLQNISQVAKAIGERTDVVNSDSLLEAAQSGNIEDAEKMIDAAQKAEDSGALTII